MVSKMNKNYHFKLLMLVMLVIYISGIARGLRLRHYDPNKDDSRRKRQEDGQNGNVNNNSNNNNDNLYYDYAYDGNYGGNNKDDDPDQVVVVTGIPSPQPKPVDLDGLDSGPTEKGKALAQKQNPCSIHAYNPETHSQIKELIDAGAQLIKYELLFKEYIDNNKVDPLSIVNSSEIGGSYFMYKPDQWSRVVGDHGRKLLSLAFNFDVLSLKMLTFGVETMKVTLTDTPMDCFGELTDDDKVEMIKNLIIADFDSHGTEEVVYLRKGEHVCHQMIEKDDDNYGTFHYECCTRQEPNVENEIGKIICKIEEPDEWINVLYILIAALKFSFLLLGPLILQKWLYNHSIRKADYLIKLKDTLRRTLLVHKVIVADDSGTIDDPNRDFPNQFKKFKQVLKVVPSDEVLPVNINRMHIQVSHSELVTEKNIPVGIFHFIWTYFFQCGIINVEPFLSCCRESIIGSWATRFLFIKLLPSGSDCNRSVRQYLSWGHVAYLIAGLILMAAIPFPYFIRLVIYYEYEEPEIKLRKDCFDDLGLKEPFSKNAFHYLTPTHCLFITLYICYLLTFLMLAFYKKYRNDTFEDIVLGSLQDLRSISRLECVRLVLSHILLPFEKFGICCGALVAVIYWPIVLPLCLITSIWYCIPTLYITGRFLVQGRPWFVRRVRVPYVPKKKGEAKIDILSLGIISLENFMLLNNISPGPSSYEALSNRQRRISIKGCKDELSKSFVGLLCTVWMFCVLIMYAECFGFMIEMFVMVLMGAIVNAGSAANYIMLGFWAITYSVSCYNDAYEDYLHLNAKIFEYIKNKLNDDIKVLTIFREEKQRYTAFKYFTKDEIYNEKQLEIEADLDSENELAILTGGNLKTAEPPPETYIDHIEYQDGKLHWNVHNLIMFVDRKDVPRIPRRLFEQICEIQAPGCPGPVYKGLLKATQKFLYMVIFLVFVGIVVLTFGRTYQISTTNQLLVTLAGGFVPFVIRFVLKPKEGSIDLSTYTFEGKVHEIFRSFKQSWPVHDLSFSIDSNVEQDIAGGSRDNKGDAPSHVDLLITIRDEDIYPTMNIRSEPGSIRSLEGPAGDNRPSPPDERPFITPGSPTNHTVNIPMVPLTHQSHSNAHGGDRQDLIPRERNPRSEITGARNGNKHPKVQDMVRLVAQAPSTLSQEELDLISNVDIAVDLTRGGNPEVRSISGSVKGDSHSVGDGDSVIVQHDTSPSSDNGVWTKRGGGGGRKDL